MEEAVTAVSRAIALDNAHDNEAAYDAYKEALGLLLPLVRSEPDPAKRAQLTDTVAGYMQRAEAIKAHLTAANRAAAQRSAAEAAAGASEAAAKEAAAREVAAKRAAAAAKRTAAPAKRTPASKSRARTPVAERAGRAGAGTHTPAAKAASRPTSQGTPAAKRRSRTPQRPGGVAARGRVGGAGGAGAGAGDAGGARGRSRDDSKRGSRSPARAGGRGRGSSNDRAAAARRRRASAAEAAKRGRKAAREGRAGKGRGGGGKKEPELDEHEKKVASEVVDKSPGVEWADIAGLEFAKRTLMEAVILPSLRPDIFTGLRAPPKGVLLFGPPGTGKTLLAKAVATESKATFFSISASSLTSKWVGEGEKLVRAMFSLARKLQPTVIFIDEIDSLLSARRSNENDGSRRLKTEFLVQLDGATSDAEDKILIMGATNRPAELDDAVLRRMVKRVYIPLPEPGARSQLIARLMTTLSDSLTPEHVQVIVAMTDGYSGSDLKALCAEAAMGPVRDLGNAIADVTLGSVRPVNLQDFVDAARTIRASVNKAMLAGYTKWNEEFGSS